MRGRKKVKLTPLQREILEFPDKEGVASICPMLTFLSRELPSAEKDKFLDKVETALIKIRRHGYLYIDRLIDKDRYTLKVEEWKEFSLRDFVVWDRETELYKLNKAKSEIDDVLIQLSQGGVDDLALYYHQISES